MVNDYVEATKAPQGSLLFFNLLGVGNRLGDFFSYFYSHKKPKIPE